MESNGRKRRRSDDNFAGQQFKVFVNQKVRDRNDENAMKRVHDKTIGKLFEGAKNYENNNSGSSLGPICKLSANGLLEFIDGMKDLKSMPNLVKVKAKCCNKDAYIATDCTDCNQKICEHCGYSCMVCYKYLCVICIVWTGSGSTDNPLCDLCKLFD